MEFLKTLDDNKAGIALFFSLASFFFSARTAWLDRARIRIKTILHIYKDPHRRYDNYMEIKVYNHGRRDLVIERIEYIYANGEVFQPLHLNQPLTIKEEGVQVISITQVDFVNGFNAQKINQLVDVYLISMKGKVIKIPKSKKNIEKLFISFY